MTDRFSPLDDGEGIDWSRVGEYWADPRAPISHDDIAPFCDWSRPRWRQKEEWWQTTPDEEHHLHQPHFRSHSDRVGWFIRRSGRAYLQLIGADDDAQVFEHSSGLVSLKELLAMLDADPVSQMLRLSKDVE